MRVKPMSRTLLSALACAGVVAAAGLAPATAHAADVFASEQVAHKTMYVPRDKSLSFRLPAAASRIVVAQPEIAKVTATSSTGFYVQGMEFGATNLLIYGIGGQLMEVVDVRVGFDAQGLQDDLAAAFPEENIQVKNLGEKLMLTGEVSHTGVEHKAEDLANRYAPDAVITRLTVRSAQQVVLEVRVLEASRSALQDIGFTGMIQNGSFNFSFGTGLVGQSQPFGGLALHGGSGSTSIDTAVVALEEKGVIRTLAKPNLVAMSGEKATFHAGGEYPYPVPQRNDTITVEFRKYGVELEFTPTVEDNGLIRLEVEPSVSQLDFTNSLRVAGFTVPGLIIRKTKTVVEMKEGQALSIGGLFQRDYENTLRQLPGLGEIPILSALMRSTRWKKGETELIVVITPHFTTEAEMHKAAETVAPPGKEPSAASLIIHGKSLDRPISGQDGR
jgi:pilus assembly protein CpaC